MRDVREPALELLEGIASRTAEFSQYPAYFELRTAEFVLLVDRIRRVLAGWQPEAILEIGAGGGYGLLLWSLIADRVVGLDRADEIARSRQLHAAFPPRGQVELIAGEGEDLSVVHGDFDLIVTQYVLEHVRDLPSTLRQIHERLAPGGLAIHVVPNLVDRLDWYANYRSRTGLPRRLAWALRQRGPIRTLADPLLTFTPPHVPERGDFLGELDEYRLERWVLQALRAGFEVVDHFQTRDVNWVLVTRVVSQELPV